MPPPLHPHATTPLHLTLRALSLLLPLSIFISNSSSLAGYFELYSLRQPPPIARVINCSHLLFPFPFLFFNPNNKRNQQHHRRTAINGSIAVNRVCSLWNWSSGWLSLRPFNFLPTQWMRSSSLSLARPLQLSFSCSKCIQHIHTHTLSSSDCWPSDQQLFLVSARCPLSVHLLSVSSFREDVNLIFLFTIHFFLPTCPLLSFPSFCVSLSASF